jgi:hypothetical protein
MRAPQFTAQFTTAVSVQKYKPGVLADQFTTAVSVQKYKPGVLADRVMLGQSQVVCV